MRKKWQWTTAKIAEVFFDQYSYWKNVFGFQTNRKRCTQLLILLVACVVLPNLKKKLTGKINNNAVKCLRKTTSMFCFIAISNLKEKKQTFKVCFSPCFAKIYKKKTEENVIFSKKTSKQKRKTEITFSRCILFWCSFSWQ